MTLGQWRRSGGWGDTFTCAGCRAVLQWQLVFPALIGLLTIPVFLVAIPMGPLALFPAIASTLLTHWRFGRCEVVVPGQVHRRPYDLGSIEETSCQRARGELPPLL